MSMTGTRFTHVPYKGVGPALNDVIALHTLRFHYEVVDPDDLDLDLGRAKPRPKEVQMATRLVDSLEEDFKPEAHEDSYREAVLDLIKRKARGQEIHPPMEKAERS